MVIYKTNTGMKMINIIRFRFKPERSTFLAFGLGILAIVFSLLLNLLPNDLGHWIFRIIFQISIVGIILSLIYFQYLNKKTHKNYAGL